MFSEMCRHEICCSGLRSSEHVEDFLPAREQYCPWTGNGAEHIYPFTLWGMK